MLNSKVKMIPVQSSNVKSVGYDYENKNTHVELKSGECYIYQNTPRVVFDNLRAAASVGSYMNRYLKGIYEVTTQNSLYELEKAAAPLVEYLRKHYCPHDQIIVSYDFVKVTSDSLGVPFKY